MKIPRAYFQSDDVVFLARDLVGKSLYTSVDGQVTGGIITETEAYAGITDRASHAYGGRRTPRTEVMYRAGGVSYIYLCYGIHFLFNIVTGGQDIPHAVLIRGIWPTMGIDVIRSRRGNMPFEQLANGPGKLCSSLKLSLAQNGQALDGDTVWLENKTFEGLDRRILTGRRIGVDYAGRDALLPWRFFVDIKKASRWLRTLH